MKLPSDIQNTIDSSTDPNVRYIVVHNNCSSTVYPVLEGYEMNPDGSGGVSLTDTGELPSGWVMLPDEYKLLKFPNHVAGGRIGVRTDCTMTTGLYGQGLDGYYCSTGHCPIPFDNNDPTVYNSSQKGLLCGKTGALPPASLAEFAFSDSGNFYDVSLADGYNTSVLMVPIKNADTAVPADQDANYWCTQGACTIPEITKDSCPAELRVYSLENKLVGCQSICKAISITKDIPLGKDGKYNTFQGPLSVNEPDAYNMLLSMGQDMYYWDSDATTPTLNQNPNKPANGRWKLDNGTRCTDKSKCISVKDLVCCNNNGTDCGNANIEPSFKGGSDQACSPYVIAPKGGDTPEYNQHKCWSENWPISASLQDYCDTNNLKGSECHYRNVFKKKCQNAYSWPFDDTSSSYHCKDIGPPVHYFIEFSDPSGPSGPDVPSGGGETPSSKVNYFWYYVSGGVLLLVLLILWFILK